MSPILSPREERKDEVPKKLCQMDNHLACINCVRWSNHGKYLASAGDDKNLMVWQLAGRISHHSNHQVQQAQNSVFESANIEQWRCIATLNGHGGDILDLAWSPSDLYLASCSVDNMIIVWDANNFPQLITKITGHTGLVKGVAWDPAGKYLASQSDDKSLRVWKTSDWREESVVKEPFVECGGTTHVLRLNWSPDGQTLISAHAMNNSGSVAQLIERDGWRTQRDLVGHRKAVTCVRFNPNILYQNKSKKDKSAANGTGTKSSSTSLLSNNNNNISNNTNTNSTTTNSNNNSTINTNNNNKSSNGTSSSTATTTNTTTAASKAANGATAKSSSKNNNSLTTKTNKYCCVAVGSRDRSISVWLTSQPRPLIVAHDLFESSVLDISWSKDGLRLMACSQDGTVAVMIFSANELGSHLTNEEKQSYLQKLYGKSINAPPTTSRTIIVEDPELIKAQTATTAEPTPSTSSQSKSHHNNNHSISDMPDHQQSSHSNSISQNGFNECESNTSMSGMSKGPTDRQIETLLPGGKRRITPLYIQPPLPFNSTSITTFSSSKESKTKILIETTTSTPAPTPTPSFIQSTPVKSMPAIHTTVATAATVGNYHRREQVLAPKIIHRTLPPSSLDKASVFRIKDENGRDLILETENEANSDKINELRLMDESNNKIWDVLLSSKINSVIATPTLAAASCMDNSLHLFELQLGRRLVPPLVLDSPVAHIAAEKSHILVITSAASMWLWDLSQNKVLVKAESISSILQSPVATSASNSSNNTANAGGDQTKPSTSKSNHNNKSSNAHHNNNNATATATDNHLPENDIEILSCSLTESMQPLLLLSTGRAFIFDFNLHCWMLISDSNDSITRWSSCKPSLTAIKRFLIHKQVDSSDRQDTMKRNLPLTSLQAQHSFDIKRFASVINKSGSESLQVKATRSYLDQQLAAAFAIRSAHEYHYWLIQSVQHYVDTGNTDRLKDLCARLATTGSNNVELSTLGLRSRLLLREVLTILSKDLRYQRIFSEYKQILECCDHLLS